MLANSTAFYLSDIDCREAVRTATCVQRIPRSAVTFLLNRLLAPRLVEFFRLHPGLSSSLIPDSQNLSLTRREVDVALRFGEPREGGSAVLAQKIGRVMFSVFTAKDGLEVAPKERPWLVYDPIAAHLPQAAWTEAYHALTNALRIGRQGEIRDRTVEGQHYRMAGLNLLAAIIIYWNTKHLGQAAAARESAGLDCSPWLLSHSSPLGWAHILLTGEYRWKKR